MRCQEYTSAANELSLWEQRVVKGGGGSEENTAGAGSWADFGGGGWAGRPRGMRRVVMGTARAPAPARRKAGAAMTRRAGREVR